MKKLLCFLMLLAPLAAFGAPMTNDDVVKMVKGGLGDAIILQSIDTAEPQYDTSADGLIKLKQGGVSDTVIQRIMQRSHAGVAPAEGSANAQLVRTMCQECGTVTGLREIEKPRKVGSGTAAGAVLGGVLGYAAGGPRHRTAGTVVGAVGGAAAGNVIENRAGANSSFEIGVRFDDGSTRVFTQDSHSSLRQGSRVRLVNGALVPL